MMPQTVPNSPTKGLTEPMVASSGRPGLGLPQGRGDGGAHGVFQPAAELAGGLGRVAPLAPFGMAGAERRGGEALAARWLAHRRGVGPLGRQQPGLPRQAAQRHRLLDDDGPAGERGDQQQRHHPLHDRIGLQDQGDRGEVGRGGGHAGLPVRAGATACAGPSAVAAAEQPGGEAGGEERRHGEAGQEDDEPPGAAEQGAAMQPALQRQGFLRRAAGARAALLQHRARAGVDRQDAAAADFGVGIGGAEGHGPGLALARRAA